MQKKSSIAVSLIVIMIIVIIGSLLFAYFYTKNLPEEPSLEDNKINVFFKPINYQTKEPISLDYKLLEQQIIRECLIDTEAEDFYETAARIQAVTKREELGDIEHETAKQQKKKIENEFYAKYPYLFSKNIKTDACYTKDVTYRTVSEGTFAHGLNQLKINKHSLFYLYYWDRDNYYFGKEIFHSKSLEVEISNETDRIQILENNNSIYILEGHNFAKNLSIDVWGDIHSNKDNNIRLNVQSDSELRQVGICFKWTFGISNVQSGYRDVAPPQRLLDFDKCFATDDSLTVNHNFTKQYDFSVKTGELIDSDQITIVIIDKDRYDDGDKDKLSFEYADGKNIGAEDFIKIYKPLRPSD